MENGGSSAHREHREGPGARKGGGDFKADFEPEELTLTRKGLRCFGAEDPTPLWSSLPWRDPHAQTGAGCPALHPQPWASGEVQASHASRHGAGPGWRLPCRKSLFGRCLALGTPLLGGVGQVERCFQWAAASARPPLQTPGLWSKVPITRQRLTSHPVLWPLCVPVWRVLCPRVHPGRDEGKRVPQGPTRLPLCIRLQTDWRTPTWAGHR